MVLAVVVEAEFETVFGAPLAVILNCLFNFVSSNRLSVDFI
jgi:hypothetical protein